MGGRNPRKRHRMSRPAINRIVFKCQLNDMTLYDSDNSPHPQRDGIAESAPKMVQLPAFRIGQFPYFNLNLSPSSTRYFHFVFTSSLLKELFSGQPNLHIFPKTWFHVVFYPIFSRGMKMSWVSQGFLSIAPCTRWCDVQDHILWKFADLNTHVEKHVKRNLSQTGKGMKRPTYIYIYISSMKTKKHQHISSNSMRFQDSFVLSTNVSPPGQRLGTPQPQRPVESSCFSGRISRGWLVIVGCWEILPTWPTFLGWWSQVTFFSMAKCRDLQLVDQNATLNHLVWFLFLFPMVGLPQLSPSLEDHSFWITMLVTPFVKQHHLDVFVHMVVARQKRSPDVT